MWERTVSVYPFPSCDDEMKMKGGTGASGRCLLCLVIYSHASLWNQQQISIYNPSDYGINNGIPASYLLPGYLFWKSLHPRWTVCADMVSRLALRWHSRLLLPSYHCGRKIFMFCMDYKIDNLVFMSQKKNQSVKCKSSECYFRSESSIFTSKS